MRVKLSRNTFSASISFKVGQSDTSPRCIIVREHLSGQRNAGCFGKVELFML
jgi:hypothetical protein